MFKPTSKVPMLLKDRCLVLEKVTELGLLSKLNCSKKQCTSLKSIIELK